MFEPGQSVRVRADMPPGHVRTPHYLRGHSGIVERHLGAFPNPEQLAYGLPAEPVPLYRVRFRIGDLWSEPPEVTGDTLEAEIFAHWLTEISDAP